MNATEKAKILRERGYNWASSKRSGTKIYNWYLKRNPLKTIASGTSFAETTQRVYDYEFGLEAQVTQAANDLAGQEAYEEVRLETLEKENDDLKTQIVNLASESIVLEQQNEELRAENEALKAENSDLETENEKRRLHIAQIEAENGRMKEMIERAIAKNDWLSPLQAMALLGALKREFDALPKQPAPLAQAEASEVTVAKPKKAIPARMRVNWNQRGFSSGSYEVLGYSHEKQCYMLNISTDANRPMLKAVKMADCLAVQA